jgi:cell wall-associated NlpC family hydrolase
MAHHHTNKVLRAAVAGVLGSVAALAAAVPAAAAARVPDKPTPRHGDGATTVKSRIATLYRRAEELTQTYDAAQEQAARLTIAVRRSQGALQKGRADYTKQQAALGRMAAAQYRAGGLDKRLGLMLSEHPDEYLSSAAMVDRLSEDQLRKLASVAESQRQLVQLQRTAADELASLAEARLAAAKARVEVATQLRQAQTLLNTLSVPQRHAVAAADEGSDGSMSAYESIPIAELPDILPTGRARTAIDAAFAALGKPYVYGAEGPDAFDCSGLMQRIWRQAGVELPRTSSEQADIGQRIPLTAIQPGDLVIYYAARDHIGIYIGGGRIIHAPHPGTDVRISPLNSMPVNTVVRV